MFGKSLKNQSAGALLSLGALLLLTVAGSVAVSAQPRNQSYGLGIPKTAGTGGATRGNLPQVVMLVPEDGARTLSDRPTFYWYVGEAPFRTTFFLRDANETGAKTLYRVEAESKKAGLYRVTLPESVRLSSGQVHRWQVRWQDSRGVGQIDVASAIKLEPNPQVQLAIAKAPNDLAKARILAANLYWYDALDAYTKWLEANPNDKTARQERAELIRAGFQSSSVITKDNINILLATLDRNVPQQIALTKKD
jgi:hypothetical protein